MPHVPKLVILDRDGVINLDSDQFIKSPDEWIAIDGSLEAIAELNQAGYQVVVATNQSGIGRGLFEAAALNAMHEKMYKALAAQGGRVDAVFFCPHTAAEGCDCRKPKAGMFHEIARRFDVDLTGVPVVGDSLRDLQAGEEVGAVPHLVLTGKGTKTLQTGNLPPGTQVHQDLRAFARALLSPAHHPPGTPSRAPTEPAP
ncbi:MULTISPECIES: D-glycero-beta-D-manno-heptose 1,7-bisphosphate 7-phosphatase [Ralstonia solanacearum species complex]|uniref:D-glycero-beta-D-manno-heptose 1,7-bisphosphate 7-phosphatase n=1 Tax=Ralstonia solanacearum species complex TaxID=3116862 RepID=UPI00078CD517|nr:D-glycero-beta-D-manno-heptose 1,7-bisphosphate 7-phosphatase [Ralstonia solanacearum]BEU73125.1 D-glycero-beta-D-manno-heptose 1,7-bisphosphate 7-phosphatase [Ralstonia pseudosolanacearum]AMP38533.1 D,D-heptose 1,7-bisphosphate phosphatase [Ralstonia solanacearum]AXV77934.1 D-glycero-beta-D-manno-heptose-1,7-bisphosphate 7-phosphatase [Ralstonia solanacearum]AXV87360.1 D-glycero-beta-D-manno-heptose-1,7-bisphosphate 7-phosphatase [Ralstonia solanacearum]AXV91959.1 D-glycero-beta-D-manno-he